LLGWHSRGEWEGEAPATSQSGAPLDGMRLDCLDMGQEVFTARFSKDGRVRIFWEGRCVMTLGGDRAARLRSVLEGASFDAQQHSLQRVTGNFKRGNERSLKR